MTESKDYRLYLEQRFADLTTLMNARFNTVDEDNETIKGHLKELNGTVKDHTKEISDLAVNDELHITNCPAMSEIQGIKEDLQEYHFFKKYPKLVLIIIALLVTGMIMSAISTVESIGSKRREKETQQSVKGIQYQLAPTRGGYVHYGDSINTR